MGVPFLPGCGVAAGILFPGAFFRLASLQGTELEYISSTKTVANDLNMQTFLYLSF